MNTLCVHIQKDLVLYYSLIFRRNNAWPCVAKLVQGMSAALIEVCYPPRALVTRYCILRLTRARHLSEQDSSFYN